MPTIPESDMRAPRLELRWQDIPDGKSTDTGFYTVECVYSLVIALGEYDIRAEREDESGEPLPNLTEQSVKIGSTLSTGSAAKRYHEADGVVDSPFRDGAHARWDAEQLGGLPIYAVACGKAYLVSSGDATLATRDAHKGNTR